MQVPEAVADVLIDLRFNQDASCFSVGTSKGFVVYNSDPLKERFRRDEFGGSLGIVEMLFKCNILALVGGGPHPVYNAQHVIIWDDFQNKRFAELEFRDVVKAVRLRRDRIVVALASTVYVYNFADLKLIAQHETCMNPQGLVALSSGDNIVLCCPGVDPGKVRVHLYGINKTHLIEAHNNELSQLVLNQDGTLLATASSKGTLVRIWDTTTGKKVDEFRRGRSQASIFSIAWSRNSDFLVVGSDTGTVHVYGVGAHRPAAGTGAEPPKNKQSRLSFASSILPSYFSSEWSFANFTVQNHGTKYLCAFGEEEGTIIVVSNNGSYGKYRFTPGSSTVTRIGSANFMGDNVPSEEPSEPLQVKLIWGHFSGWSGGWAGSHTVVIDATEDTTVAEFIELVREKEPSFRPTNVQRVSLTEDCHDSTLAEMEITNGQELHVWNGMLG